MATTSTVAPEKTADMKTKTLITAIAAALSVTITLAACGGSTSGAARGTAQDPAAATTVSSTTVAPRGTAQDPAAATTVSSTTVAPRGTAQDPATPPRSRRRPSHDPPPSSTNSFRCTAPGFTCAVTVPARRQWC